MEEQRAGPRGSRYGLGESQWSWTKSMGAEPGSTCVGDGNYQYLQISETVELLHGLPEVSRCRRAAGVGVK